MVDSVCELAADEAAGRRIQDAIREMLATLRNKLVKDRAEFIPQFDAAVKRAELRLPAPSAYRPPRFHWSRCRPQIPTALSLKVVPTLENTTYRPVWAVRSRDRRNLPCHGSYSPSASAHTRTSRIARCCTACATNMASLWVTGSR